MNSKKPKVHNYFLGIKMCKVFLIEHANIPTIYFIFLPASDNAQLGAVFLSKAEHSSWSENMTYHTKQSF